MKVSVVPSYRDSKEFTVELEQGHQLFRLDYSGAKQEARFMAKMFRLALVRHSAEVANHKPVVRKRRKPVAINNTQEGSVA